MGLCWLPFASPKRKFRFRRSSPGSDETHLRDFVRGFSFPPASVSVAPAQGRRLLRIGDRLKGGGWRRILRIASGLIGLSYFLAIAIYLTNSHGYLAHPVATPISIVLGLYFFLVLRRRQQRKRYFGSIRIYYSAEGLQLQDATSVARISWDQFVGYLEGDQLFLLYHNPRLYRIVPKRALAEREQQFRELVQDKLPGFDYRVPFAAPARVQLLR